MIISASRRTDIPAFYSRWLGNRLREGFVPLRGGGRVGLCGTAVDLIYVPAQSEFLRIAAQEGKKTVNGASMLFYQAYMADCIYLGCTPEAEQAKALWEAYREE